MRPYSSDLRERVISSLEAGRTCRETAALFGVSVSSVVKWSQRYRATGSVAAQRKGGRRSILQETDRTWLLEQIAAKPDITLQALQTELAEHGLSVSHGTLWNFCTREGISLKKKPSCRRAGSTGRSPETGAMEEISGPN
jgi:transposase